MVGPPCVTVGVSATELAAAYPRLYHMAEADAWPSISVHGLRSTTALLDLYGYRGAARVAIEDARRPAMVELRGDGLPAAQVRDNLPMTDADLVRCLRDGLTPSEWYSLLNQRVFFWVSEKRLETLLGARAYRKRDHDILILDTASVLASHAAQTSLSPMNSGNTKPFAHPRGRDTFLPLAQYPFWLRKARGLEPVVELAVDYALADVEAHVLRVERRSAGQAPRVLWQH